MDPARFILDNTAVERPALVPEISLYLATEVTPIWQATEDTLAQGAVPPPFWAFAWAGGQALARYLLDNPAVVAGRTVLDFGSGSGLVAIAAAKAGAAAVTAAEIDRFAAAAISLNATLNQVEITVAVRDPIEGQGPVPSVVTAGDICYEQPMADRAIGWLRGCVAAGSLAFLGDPGRTYLPKSGLRCCARYRVPTSRELEDSDFRDSAVWQILPRG